MTDSTSTDFKIIVIGKAWCCKTSFVNKWTKNIFSQEYKATIVSEYNYKIYEHNGKYYRIQLWDIAGQDKNIYLTKTFTKGAHGAVVVCDATNTSTREEYIKI